MASTGLAGELRRALYHLYDPAGLRRSPLVATFGLGEAQDPAPALRRVLTEAIDSLKPGLFELPKGSYATVVMRELMKTEAELPDGEDG